jgi:predicted DsbA family dithiol-disulfide isomerase
MARIAFEYWSDPLCIWAFVAQPKLDRILEQAGDKLEVRYHVVPVFGSIPWRLSEGPWCKAGVEGRVEATRRIAEEHGRSDVVGTCWTNDCPSSSWAVGAAVKAAFSAEEAGAAPTGSATSYLQQLREVFFVEQRNIARREVQLELADRLDIPRASIESRLDDGSALAALWEDDHRRQELKIQGSPTYVFDGGRAMLYGNFSFGILHALVQEIIGGIELGASGC